MVMCWGLSIHIFSISSDLLNKTDIKWLNLSVAEVFSQVLLGVDDVFVAHTLVDIETNIYLIIRELTFPKTYKK